MSVVQFLATLGGEKFTTSHKKHTPTLEPDRGRLYAAGYFENRQGV